MIILGTDIFIIVLSVIVSIDNLDKYECGVKVSVLRRIFNYMLTRRDD